MAKSTKKKVETTKDKIKAYILNNQSFTNEEIAIKFSTTKETVKEYKKELRKEGRLPKLETGWRQKNKPTAEVIAAVKDKSEDQILAEKLIAVFKGKERYSYTQLADMFDVGPGRVEKLIKALSASGYNFRIDDSHAVLSKSIPKAEAVTLDIRKMSTGFYKFGAIGDNHMCSKYERLDVLNALYDLYEKEGIKTVYNTGNWIDGERRFNRSDLKVHGMDAQVEYFVDNYPKRKGITTYFIAGDDHEGWYVQDNTMDIGRYAEMKAQEAGRSDLVYLGYMEADIVLPAKNGTGKTVVRVLHPGGGSSYAISYSVQKIIESYQGGEKPDVLLIGHYHKADYVFCRGVHAVQTGCTQDQSPFMRKKKLAAHLGGWIIEMATDENGAVTRFKQEFMPFYDNAYYSRWSYKWK
jgi:hypothetical protein